MNNPKTAAPWAIPDFPPSAKQLCAFEGTGNFRRDLLHRLPLPREERGLRRGRLQDATWDALQDALQDATRDAVWDAGCNAGCNRGCNTGCGAGCSVGWDVGWDGVFPEAVAQPGLCHSVPPVCRLSSQGVIPTLRVPSLPSSLCPRWAERSWGAPALVGLSCGNGRHPLLPGQLGALRSRLLLLLHPCKPPPAPRERRCLQILSWGGCSAPPAPRGTAWKSTGDHPPAETMHSPAVRGEDFEPPSSSSPQRAAGMWENTDRGLSGARGIGGRAQAELLAGCN